MSLFRNSFVEQFNLLTDTQKMYWKELYQDSAPFPHLVVENAFDEGILSEVLNAWPVNYQWRKTAIAQEVKQASPPNLPNISNVITDFLGELNGEYFINFLKELTGITHLEGDVTLEGGGMHNMPQQHKLHVHVDYGWNIPRTLFRRINVLIYLNKEWKDEYEGHLELVAPDKKTIVKKIKPDFNTMVIFNTSLQSWHGVRKPIQCPENMSRKSLALYFYSKLKPFNEDIISDETTFIDI